MLCPITLRGCVDDLCHGSGECFDGGGEMVEVCAWCNKPILDDVCACGPDEGDDRND
jgi:hypothetical protein